MTYSVWALTRYCIAMDRLRGPGGPIRNTSCPKRSFCIIHRRCWTTAWGRESETAGHNNRNKASLLQLHLLLLYLQFNADIPSKHTHKQTVSEKIHTVFDRNKFWILWCFEFINYFSNCYWITCKNQDKYMRTALLRWFLQ